MFAEGEKDTKDCEQEEAEKLLCKFKNAVLLSLSPFPVNACLRAVLEFNKLWFKKTIKWKTNLPFTLHCKFIFWSQNPLNIL